LCNALNNKHGLENISPTKEPGSKVIDYVFVSEGLLPHITAIGMLRQDAVFASDHRTFFMDLNVESCFGHETDAMPGKQLRKLRFDENIR
jgi:endonuclease/exonuclease/phosphatase family metal-dependent hydrolase